MSRAIEEFARSQGHVTAIVVPWESDATTLSMAVTAVKSDGWAIEHTNLAFQADQKDASYIGRLDPDWLGVERVSQQIPRCARQQNGPQPLDRHPCRGGA